MVSESVSLTQTLTPRVQRALHSDMKLPPRERLTLAKLLLESVLTDTRHEEADWIALGLESFQQDWDNADDAIYDDWREHYGVAPATR
jgi:hypothetical protein